MHWFIARVSVLVVFASFFASVVSAPADVLVRDTWVDGSRAEPPPPAYTEFGSDSDGDGDLESAWYNTGGTMTATPGHLNTTIANPTFWTTYFAPSGSPVTLAKSGDQIKVTWKFIPSSVTTTTTGRPLAIGLIYTPDGARLTGDGTPPNAAYDGYATFFGAYYGQLFGGPMQIGRRTAPGTSSPMFDYPANPGPFYPSSGLWTNYAGGSGAGGNPNGSPCTMTVSATRDSAGWLVVSTTVEMDGVGILKQASFTHATPSTYRFNTFAFFAHGLGAPGGDVKGSFDTTQFKVEFTNVYVPTIQSIINSNGAFTLTWNSVSGRVYQAQYSTNFVANNWFDLGGPITATTSSAAASDPIGAGPFRFYRVALLP